MNFWPFFLLKKGQDGNDMNMMKLNITAVVSLFSLCSMACSDDVIRVRYDGQKVDVSGDKASDSLIVRTEGTNVYVENLSTQQAATIRLSGKSDNGQFVLKTRTKDRIELDNVQLQSAEGAPLWIKNKKKVEIAVIDGTTNALTVTACEDTANLKSAVIFAKDKLLLSGNGRLDVLASGDGCKGINVKKNLTINDVTLDVRTTGNNLGKDNRGFGGPGPGGPGGPGGFPGGGPGGFNPDDMSEDVKLHFEEMRKNFADRDFPIGGPGGHPDNNRDEQDDKRQGFPMGGPGGPRGNDVGRPAGPPQGEGPEEVEGLGFKQKYISTCKGIKSGSTITINSGHVSVYTSSAGAEGIEGKNGVTINGGVVEVNSVDDAINAGGAIRFNGGKTTAISRHNDAVDANPEGGFMPPPMFGNMPDGGREGDRNQEAPKAADPLIFIAGGEVYAYSWVGVPEEGFDCDFSPIEVSGGSAFSIGTGMGDMPSVPTVQTAKQPTALIVGLNLVKGKQVVLRDKAGKVVFEREAPFSFNRSSSLLTCPALKVGEKFTLECGEWKKEFEMNENFTIVR